MTANDPLELVGVTIADKYLVENVVGEGGFAVVYRAVHQIWNRPVALKVFKALDEVPEAMRDKLLKEFVQEGALLAELSEKSAAIVQARDVGMLTTKKGASIPYMVLEWLEGRSLEGILERERSQGAAPRSLGQAMALLQPVAQALSLAHDRGIAHRDVKPANVFVLGDAYVAQPSVKLLDFGIAKVVQDAQKMGGSFTKTSGQITSFTPAYGAPEQFSRDYGATGPWTDVFALALMVVELITGREPLGGDTLTQLAFASVDASKRPTPRAMGAEVSDEIEAVFARALAVRPENRFRTAGEMWSALEAAARGEAATFATSSTMMASPGSMAVLQVPQPSSGSRPTNTTSRGVSTDPTPSATAPAGGGKGGLLAGVGLVALIGVGGAIFALRGGGGGAPNGMASASAAPVVSAAPSASVSAPPTKCPPGMKLIPGGNTFIGSEPGNGVPEAETPRFPVKLSPYCMDVHEVTAAKYTECAKSGGCARLDGDLARNEWDNITPMASKVYDPLCTMRVPGEKGEYPANCISWREASEYCKLQNGALPTEAQWEFAARGSSQLKFPWGDDEHLEARLNACGSECLAWGMKNDPKNFGNRKMYGFDDHFETLAPVGQFKAGASQFGIEDLSGNVFEWVQDTWARYTPGERVTDPQGPPFQERTADGERGERVVRGGAWNSVDLVWLRPTFRWHRPPHYRTHGIGFRCVVAPRS
ncbi:MAG: bifunctional serine/threonine-protein kinase/formylglycine-generating enzyme family protein [Polyangiaceae bacterium]